MTQANLGYDETGAASILEDNLHFNILNQEIDSDGLLNIHKLNIMPEDTNGNGLPNDVDLMADLGSGEINLLDPSAENWVYFYRTDTESDYVPIKTEAGTEVKWAADNDPVTGLYKRAVGTYPLNFAWFHRTPQYHLVDPSSTNIIDIFIIARGYYTAVRDWLSGKSDIEPELPTPLQLRTDYAALLDNKMISDTVILHPGKIKLLFGSKATPELQSKIKVISSGSGVLTNNQIKVRIVEITEEFFDINKWEFGESFYFTELAAVIHNELAIEIDTVVLVPQYTNNQFGDMFQVQSREDEILQPHITVDNIEIIQSLNSQNLRQNTTA